MFKINKKFKNFEYGLGGIPLTYLESLSYEEQLLWFCKNLKELKERVDELDPTPSPTPTPSEEKFYILTGSYNGIGSGSLTTINLHLPEGFTSTNDLYVVGGKFLLKTMHDELEEDFLFNYNVAIASSGSDNIQSWVDYTTNEILFRILMPVGASYVSDAYADAEVTLIVKEYKEGEE